MNKTTNGATVAVFTAAVVCICLLVRKAIKG